MDSVRLIETVKKAQNGDDNALQDLYLDVYKNVYYLALRTLKNPDDAEDITQEVFIAMREKLTELREPAAFYRWINRVTVNKCTNLLNKSKRLIAIDDDESFIEPEEDNPLRLPDKAIDDAETVRLIVEVIDNLPDNQRVCIYYYYYQQMTIAQISEELGVKENTVKSRLALARAKIKAELERKEREEGIKLYAVPLALTPILRKAFQEFVMPEGVAERIWENVMKAEAGNTSSNGDADKPKNTNGSGSGAPPVMNSAASSTAKAGMTLATKIIIGIIAAAVIAAVAIFIPRLLDTPSEPTPPVVTDEATFAPDDTESSEQTDSGDSADTPSEDNQEPTVQEAPESDFVYHTYPDGQVSLRKYLGNAEQLVIPAELGGNPVTSVGDEVFAGNTTLKSVIFPESMTIIGDEAFKDCVNLSSVKLSASTMSLMYEVFGNCTSLAEISIPNTLKVLNVKAFSGCSNLEAAYFEGDVPGTFHRNAFENVAPSFTIYYREGAAGWGSPTHEGYPTATWDGVSAFGNDKESTQPGGNGFGIEPVIWQNAMSAYIEVMENVSGSTTSCLYDTCGNAIPELFLRRNSDGGTILQVYTYDGEAKLILEHGLTGNTGDFKLGDKAPTMFTVMATNEGDIYVALEGRGTGWNYKVWYFNDYSNTEESFIHHDVSSDKAIRYVVGFDIFDGYASTLWNDYDNFTEKQEELRSTVKAYIFEPDIFGMEFQAKMNSNPEMFPSNYWNNADMIEYLEDISNGAPLSFGNQ